MATSLSGGGGGGGILKHRAYLLLPASGNQYKFEHKT